VHPNVTAVRRMRTGLAGLAGVVVALVVARFLDLPLALLIGWDVAAAVYLVWVWLRVRRRSAAETAREAASTDPGRVLLDTVPILAALVSLVAVAVVLVRAPNDNGAAEYAQVTLALASVLLSWVLVHTIFMLRYARLWYADPAHPCIDFEGTPEPDYGDFAYFAFTVGMTYQVADTDLHGSAIRRTVLRHALLAFVFGTGVLAATVNLVASLSSSS
jgi:uncharacterized membrane protein